MRDGSPTGARALLDLVGEAHGFEDLDAFRPGILELLNRAVPSAWASYNEVGAEPEQAFAVVLPTFPAALFPVFARLAHQNPLVAEHQRTGDGRPRRISDLVERDAFQRLDLYRECYSAMGVESQVAFTLPARPPLLVGIALSRGEEDFADAEVEFLARARPHLIQAYRNVELASARAAALRALEAGLESAGTQLVVLDPHGRVEFATETARELLGGLGSNALPAVVGAWMRAQPKSAGASGPLVLELDRGSLLIRLLPGRHGDRRDVLLVESAPGGLTVEALRGLGLTAREAETLRWIALGESAAGAARRMRIAPRTADKHLQRVYAKLGVSSAAQASATAWAAVGVRPGR